MGLVQSKVFKNFQKIVQQCPTQVLRYEFKGNPLFYAEDKELMSGDLPKCPRCRLQCVFEFQLMPAILTVLPVSCMITTASNDNKEKKIVVGLDFGTVLAYTCSANCDADCMKFETVEECDEILRRLDAGEDITSYNEEFAVAQIE
jgi:pre-rRNA-processing protein TSR4